MSQFDQFTRWQCPRCCEAGIDSWNKAMFDGIANDPANPPNPWILGDNCCHCGWPVVTRYTVPEEAPRAIVSPDGRFDYEAAAFDSIAADPASAITLSPTPARDADWSRGCLHAKHSGSAQ
ncbi:hypothetical protein [Sphingobium cupriresistens]|uniref:Uncharacterized protein n=1 Tax=Sphingobium cupriresistens LL01 TaxID=1420583 RepID=A0A0J7XUI1_9SPHN|nr:hypothetical protein [Sphingobium cupriresistens]KMS54713.1 hypothetical protein V473_15310 [Sphingobium cupriresistens LL01]